MPILNDLDVRVGPIHRSRKRRDEVLISQAFAAANHLEIGDALSAVINGKWERLQIVGIAVSPRVRLRSSAGRSISRQPALRNPVDVSRRHSGPRSTWTRAFNDVVLNRCREKPMNRKLSRVLIKYSSVTEASVPTDVAIIFHGAS